MDIILDMVQKIAILHHIKRIMNTIRKSITFTDQQDSWIKLRVQNGDFTNDSEYIRDLVRKDQEQNMKLLEKIYLRDNNIQQIPANVYEGFQTSVGDMWLMLAKNNLESIDADAFVRNDLKFTLGHVDLEHNKISNVKLLYHGCSSNKYMIWLLCDDFFFMVILGVQ